MEVNMKMPSVPPIEEPETFASALGRLAIGFSASEFYLAMICMRLNSWADEKSTAPSLIADTNTVFTMFFSVESTRGRRELTKNLADVRKGEGYINESWKKKIDDLLGRHAKIATQRNRFFHTPLANDRDGHFVLMSNDILIHRTDRTKLQSNPLIRRNNARLTIGMINRVTDEIEAWIEDTRKLCLELESKRTLSS